MEMELEALKDLIKNVAGEHFIEKMEESKKKGEEILTKTGGQIPAAVVASMSKEASGKIAVPADDERGLAAARYLRVKALAKMNEMSAVDVAAQMHKQYPGPYGQDVVNALEESAAVNKALSAGLAGAGAEFIPPSFSTDLIELLRSRTVVRSLGARQVSMPNGTFTMPKQTGTATASYVGESETQRASQGSTGNVMLSAKKLRVTIPVTNDLIRYSGIDADRFIRDDAQQAMTQKENLVFLRSAGGEYAPKGLRYLCPADQVFTANATANLENVTVDLGKLVLSLEDHDVPFVSPGWTFSPRTRHFLMTIRDGLGNFAFRAEMLGGSLWGFPWRATTAIPSNLGTGTDESEIMLIDANSVIIGDVHGIEILSSSEASYTNSAGNVVSAFDRDETVLRALQRHDIQLRHTEAVAILDTVKWGKVS